MAETRGAARRGPDDICSKPLSEERGTWDATLPNPPAQHPRPFPRPLELGHLPSLAPGRQLRGRAGGEPAGTEVKPVGREQAGPAAPPSWGNRAGSPSRRLHTSEKSPGWVSSLIQQSEASPRDGRFPLPRSARRPGKPVRSSVLSEQAKSPDPREDAWP